MVKIKAHWLEITALVFFLLAVYLILTTIFGNSATPIEVTITLIGGLSVLIYRMNREIGEIKTNMKHSFGKIKEDINLIRGDLGLIKKKLRVY